MKPNRRVLLNLLLALCLIWPAQGQAAEIRVAVAANFTETAKTLGIAFERQTGHRVTHSFGSSGQLATQIQQGAPFDVFLSADAERPLWLEQQNLTVTGSRFVYAYGRLVLWSGDKSRTDVNLRGLRAGRFNHLAIADPLTAPYGVAAEEVLKKHDLFAQITPKIVKGGNIAQTYGFVKTRAADMGFVALSQVKGRSEGIYWLVPKSDHSPIDQQAVWLKRSENNVAARAYMAFLKSPEARKIIRAQGYEVD
ncbi:MAG: molybdate ABC transporter substrate-binding protein [Asticcacaulis sp.]